MLFYTTNSKNLEYIPSGYNVIALTKSDITNNNCKYVRLKNEYIMPSLNNLSKKEKKEAYNTLLLNRKSLVAYIVKEAVGHQTDSIVLYCSEEDISRYGFNYIKVLCKFIKKQFGVVSFKFTTTVTKHMRMDAYVSDNDRYKIMDECKNIYDIIVKDGDS